ncbi:hypothetical protein NPX13_g10760 [Xylaria arbuscula]|uniref:Uncharacterized protein n=1 Tax=Xylaria arbuscula TaxID=114810 RepID=A0A9W8TGG9_9PEZI|nr:hypothetical protein NPX13_g10760 [Xylaria arbuscula]
MSSSSGTNSTIVNPHGAPQNPGDIYLQSEDIRRRVFDPSHDRQRSYGETNYQGSPALQNTGFDWNSPANNYRAHIPAGETSANSSDYTPLSNVAQASYRAEDEFDTKREIPDSETAYHSRWFDSIPRDTLLNLGFAPGEGMEADFFELCANPDPIDSTPINYSADQTEDEEAIWRRLVMRGRFI